LGGECLFEKAMARTSPVKFLQEVRAEGQKVTWPTRRETLITTIMVFIMTAAMAVFFFISDQIMRWVVATIIGWAG
jgi:preprotein translocase subunit SecE